MTVSNLHPIPAQRPEEEVLFRALRLRQAGMHPYDSFAIFVQPAVVLRTGRQFRPDLVVIMRSSWVIEIDGSSHTGRYVNDRTRDELLSDHSLSVLRIPVEDLNDPALVEDWVDRILQRVRAYRATG